MLTGSTSVLAVQSALCSTRWTKVHRWRACHVPAGRWQTGWATAPPRSRHPARKRFAYRIYISVARLLGCDGCWQNFISGNCRVRSFSLTPRRLAPLHCFLLTDVYRMRLSGPTFSASVLFVVCRRFLLLTVAISLSGPNIHRATKIYPLILFLYPVAQILSRRVTLPET